MEKIPKMIGVLCVLIGVLCCETCRNIPQKTLNVGVYQEEFFNKKRYSLGISASNSYK